MSHGASSSPKPWPQYELRTIFLRVPEGDWLRVKQGSKTEFRASGRAATKVQWIKTPTPVVAYALSNERTDHRSQLMVLEECWKEELRAISDESLRREGFPDFASFRRYWKIRTKRPFRPLAEVWAYRLRRWQPSDTVNMGTWMVERLYGEHLPR